MLQTVMINKKLAKGAPRAYLCIMPRHMCIYSLQHWYTKRTLCRLRWVTSFGVRVTDTYINADLSRVDEANRRVIDYVLYNKK